MSLQLASKNFLFLYPGEIIISREDRPVKTVLGSCVSVLLYDTEKKYGGITHYLLPSHSGDERNTKFGSVAIPYLIRELMKEGSQAQHIVARIYGGASLYAGNTASPSIGVKNVLVAKKILDYYTIPVVEMHVRGNSARRLIFHPVSGNCEVTVLQNFRPGDIYNPTL